MALTDKKRRSNRCLVAARWPEGPIDYGILGPNIWSAWNALDNGHHRPALCERPGSFPRLAHFMLMAPGAYDFPKALSSALRRRPRSTCKPTTFWLSKIGSVVSINLDCCSEADARDACDSIMSGYVCRHHQGAIERQPDVVIFVSIRP